MGGGAALAVSIGSTLASAYVMINSVRGRRHDVKGWVEALPEVTEAHLIYGVYDIIARVEASDIDALRDTVYKKIRSIDGVRSVQTMFVRE